jgi:hypothetical protein
VEPGDVFSFQIVRSHLPPSGGRKLFKYPKYIYLDPFLKANAELSREKRRLKKEMEDQISRMGTRKLAIARFNVSTLILPLIDAKSSSKYRIAIPSKTCVPRYITTKISLEQAKTWNGKSRSAQRPRSSSRFSQSLKMS